jgi:FtsP/CotA-like multicopper oxidase with cupredoxin domain
MTPISTNLHFHGMTVPPVCHQDDVIQTSIQPDDPPFEYRMQIPADQPPGLYWYHPHIHGFSKVQVLGGASAALIVEGIERANPALAGLPERVVVIRDQELLYPDAPPSKSEPVVPKTLIDSDGDAANNGAGYGKPAKDLSINYVPVPYPDYPPAAMVMKPGQRQLWRVLNASAITYLNLALLYRGVAQPLGIVAIDGVPIRFNGSPAPAIQSVDHIGIPPGARAEFVVKAPPLGVPGLLVTRTVDTGPSGDNDPNRTLATVVAAPDAPNPHANLSSSPSALPAAALPWVGSVAPVRVRKLYFSEKLDDPNNPPAPAAFTSPWMARRRRHLIRHQASPTSSSSKVRSRIGSSKTARWSCTTSTSINFIFSCSNGPAFRLMSRSCAIPSTSHTTTAARCNIRACACEWIFAIRVSSAPSFFTATCWSTRTAE